MREVLRKSISRFRNVLQSTSSFLKAYLYLHKKVRVIKLKLIKFYIVIMFSALTCNSLCNNNERDY